MTIRTLPLVLGAIFSLALVATGASARGLEPWDKKIDKPTRFKLVLDDQAVLDDETGLVWQRSPIADTKTWASAADVCRSTLIANRVGFRLPKFDELMTLFTLGSVPTLPPGHSFVGISTTDWYWTATTDEDNMANALMVTFGGFFSPAVKSDPHLAWCVRGPGSAS